MNYEVIYVKVCEIECLSRNELPHPDENVAGAVAHIHAIAEKLKVDIEAEFPCGT